MHPEQTGKFLRSPAGSFVYQVIGPCCQLFDREELPWPSCNIRWKGKQPSWNRVGKRFVPDLAASRCPSYYVMARDLHGDQWNQVLTIYQNRLDGEEKRWWYSKVPSGKPYPMKPS